MVRVVRSREQVTRATFGGSFGSVPRDKPVMAPECGSLAFPASSAPRDVRSPVRHAPWIHFHQSYYCTALASLARLATGSLGRLSWDSSVAPPSTCFRDRASPVLPPNRFRAARSGAGAALVVSHHLGGLPSPEVAGLLHPAADRGVRRVVTAAQPRTPRRLLSSAAAPCHHGRCLPAVLPTAPARTRTPPSPARWGSGRSIARPTSTPSQRITT